MTSKTARRNGYDFERNGTITWVGDSQHKGTDIYFSDRLGKWVIIDLENPSVSFCDHIAAVRIADGEDADSGLNQASLAMDLDGEGIWIVSADDLDEFEDGYVEVVFSE